MAHNNNGFNAMLTTPPLPPNPPEFDELRALAIRLAAQVTRQDLSPEYRSQLIATHNSILALSRFF
jgi:hypothetical protein